MKILSYFTTPQKSNINREESIALQKTIRENDFHPIDTYVKQYLNPEEIDKNYPHLLDHQGDPTEARFVESILRNYFNRKIQFGTLMEELEWENFCVEIIKAKMDVRNLKFSDFIKIINLYLDCVKGKGLGIFQ